MSFSFQLNKLYHILVPYIIGIVGAFTVAGIIMYGLGYDVLLSYRTIFLTSFSTADSIALTLLKFVPLLMLSLAFSIPLMARKFNVGIEGQFLLGGIGATIIGLTLSLPPGIHVLLALILGAAFGALWALIPAFLLYKFNVNEIIATILMNFIAFYLVDYIATGPWRDVIPGHPMTVPLAPTSYLPLIIERPSIHSGVIISVLIAIGVYILVFWTLTGYEMRAAGSNPRAARVFGINVKILAPLSLVIGGMVAGLAGAIEVTGLHYRLIEGMQSNYAPLGILIALMGKGNPLALLILSFFISMIEVGTSALQRTQGVPIELSLIIESLILIFVLVAEVIRRRR